MTLPFGTRVSLNISRSGRVGVVTGSGAALDEAPLYAVVWEDPHPGTRPLCHAAAELTVVESPDTIELRRIRFALTRLIRAFDEDDTRSMGTIDEDVQPIADAVIAWHKRQLATLSEKT